MQWLVEFWNTGDNANKIILVIISAILGIVIKELIWVNLVIIFKWIWKKSCLFVLTIKNMIFNKMWKIMRKIKRKRQYKKTIKQIEERKIDIPDHFFFGRSEEGNPELKKIFQMIEDGVIEAPKFYKINKILKDNPNLKLTDTDFDIERLKPKINPTDHFKK